MKTLDGNLYDLPKYFDLSFRSETKPEADFIESACRKHCRFPVHRILEVGCGGGRLVVELARRGYCATGLDQSRPALDYLRRRLKRNRLDAQLVQADMADFTLSYPVDAVVCTFNTFRHLLTESAARAHLHCVARALLPGGVYILGLHLLPDDASDESCERWSARHSALKVTVTLRVLSSDRKRRLELMRTILRVETPAETCRIRTEFPLRTYNAAQLRRLLNSVPEFELQGVYDFWYDLDHPLALDDEMVDTVLILRKQG